MNDSICRQNPLVKNWFDQFRIATDNINAEALQHEAVLMNCRILHGNRCYSEDGSVRDTCHDLSMDTFENLLRDWKQCADVRKRKITRQRLKYMTVKQMDTQATLVDSLKAEQSEIHFEIG